MGPGAVRSAAPPQRRLTLSVEMADEMKRDMDLWGCGYREAAAHSGRVGLASELTARGASTTEVMLAGNWKTARMVAHYSAGATAERGAVRKYL